MNAEIKVRWVEALRSGAYEQGSLYLKRGNEFCCLGVLCEVAGTAGSWRDRGDASDPAAFVFGGESRDDIPPEPFLRSLGFGGKEDVRRLWEMNDDEGLSFTAIADYIEKHL
jgi:hypothetical protein